MLKVHITSWRHNNLGGGGVGGYTVLDGIPSKSLATRYEQKCCYLIELITLH